MNGFSTAGVGRFCAVVALLGIASAAADGAPASIADSKRSALAVLRAQARPAPPDTMAIDVGGREPSLLLDEAELLVDRMPLLRYRYGIGDAQALHRGALNRLAAMPLAAGPHRLRLKLAAREADAPPDRPRAIVAFDREIRIDPQTTTLQFELTKGRLLGQPEIELHLLAATTDPAASAPDRYVVGSDADPRLREASYLIAATRPFAALQALYGLEAGAGGYTGSSEWQARLGDALIAFGLDAPGGTTEPADADRAAAVDDFNHASTLLREGRVAEAGATLETIASKRPAGEVQALLQDRANLALGYALLRNHAGASAAPAFGRVRSTGPCTNAALLGLGWSMLAPEGKNSGDRSDRSRPLIATTSTPLPRIPTLLQPALTSDIASLKLHEPYALKEALANEERALRRALVPWTELTGRDPLDPAVQEGAVAIPYAMNHIGAHPEAIDYYRRALYLLEAVDRALDRAIGEVGDGRLRARLALPAAEDRGWPWWIAAMPPQHWWLASDPRDALATPDGFYLPQLMDQTAFRGAMDDWHALVELDAALAALGDAPGASAARAALAPALQAQARSLDELALASLRQTRRHTEMYLGEARFALGRINEEQVREARK